MNPITQEQIQELSQQTEAFIQLSVGRWLPYVSIICDENGGVGLYTNRQSNEAVRILLTNILGLAWVGPCPPDEDGAPCINDWIYTAARACASRFSRPFVSPEQAEEFIRSALARPEKGHEIRRAIERAYGQAYTPAGGAPRIKANPFDPDLMRENAAKVPIQITPDWLSAQSPIPVAGVTCAQYLEAVFNAGEFVAVKIADHDRGFVYHVGDSSAAKRLANYVKLNVAGIWYYTCPVDGKYRKVQTQDGWRIGACYGDDRITDWRFLLLESDHKGFEREWLNILVQLPNVVACYTSGNVSTHALVRISATSKEEFNRIADEYKRLVVIGACEGSLTATRATRLPGIVRGDNGREQRLLYLNPAGRSPIYKKEKPAGNQPTGFKQL